MLDLSSAIGLGTTLAVVGVLLPSAARREGLESIGLAALAALPFLASLMSLAAGRIGPKTPGRLAVLRALGALGLLLVLLAPSPWLIAAATFGFWVAFALGVPLQQRIWSSMYPSADRGRLLGIVGTGRAAAGAIALLAFSLVATNSGWLSIIALVAALGAVSALAISRLSVPTLVPDRRTSAMGSVRAALGRPMLRRIALGQLLFGGGLVAAPALVAIVYIDRLGLGMEHIALVGLLGAATTTVAVGLWGRVATRTGPMRTMAAGTLFGAMAVVVYALASDFGAVVAATMLLGAAGAAVDVSWPLLIADHAAADEQGAVAGGLNAIMGVRGLVTPFVVMLPIQLGLMDETAGLLLCATAVFSGALVYAHLAGLTGYFASRVRRLRIPAIGQSSPASALMPVSSSSGWPESRRSRLMRSVMAGWVLKRPLALLSSFLTGLTT